ncbi:MAG: glycosyltransferase family 39 protein [Candidatus Levybacteria bacterium]|nr:glycosyltransferase family 39 protein [Candidatus Levybacteria bacterium]
MKRDIWFLLAVCFFFFLFRLPSLIEPYWYGDEGIYQVVGSALKDGRVLYRDIWDNKPPLLYVMHAIFGPDQYSVRLVSLLFGMGAVIAIFYLAKQLFKDCAKQFQISVISTALFAFLFSIPFLEGNIANAENFMLLPIIIAALLIISRFYFLAGFILGIALLFKIVAVFDIAAFVTFITISKTLVAKQNKGFAVVSLLSGSALPFVGAVIYFWMQNALGTFFEATFFQNVSYVGYKNKFFISQGLLITKTILLSLAVGAVVLKRKILSEPVIFVFLWLFFSLFNAFFSQRPYTHYVIVLLPSLSLAAGIIFFLKKNRNIKIIIVAIAFIITIVQFKLTHPQKMLAYYQNFIEFITHEKSVEEYLGFFDSNTPRDYFVSYYLRTHTKKEDAVFIWGNSAQIYTLADKLPPGKYTVAYHISNKSARSETEQSMMVKKPRYVVVLPDSPFPFYLTNYTEKLTIRDTKIYERIF